MRASNRPSVSGRIVTLAIVIAGALLSNLQDCGAATTWSQPSKFADAATARPCVRDARAVGTLFGNLPQSKTALPAVSYVQILDDSPATESYVRNLATVLAGRPIVPTTSDANDETSLETFATQQRNALQALAAANVAYLHPDGRFSCRGFAPGAYLLLATTHSLGSSSLVPKLAGHVPMTDYFVGRASVPASRRPIDIGVSFDSIGNSPG